MILPERVEDDVLHAIGHAMGRTVKMSDSIVLNGQTDLLVQLDRVLGVQMHDRHLEGKKTWVVRELIHFIASNGKKTMESSPQ